MYRWLDGRALFRSGLGVDDCKVEHSLRTLHIASLVCFEVCRLLLALFGSHCTMFFVAALLQGQLTGLQIYLGQFHLARALRKLGKATITVDRDRHLSMGLRGTGHGLRVVRHFLNVAIPVMELHHGHCSGNQTTPDHQFPCFCLFLLNFLFAFASRTSSLASNRLATSLSAQMISPPLPSLL